MSLETKNPKHNRGKSNRRMIGGLGEMTKGFMGRVIREGVPVNQVETRCGDDRGSLIESVCANFARRAKKEAALFGFNLVFATDADEVEETQE